MKKRRFREIDLSLTVFYEEGSPRHGIRKVLIPETVVSTFAAKSLLHEALRKVMHQIDSDEKAYYRLENKNGNI